MKVKDFDLEQTLECGQCFNFEKLADHEYIVVAKERMLHVRQAGDELLFLNASAEDVENIWIPYFDLDRDYGAIKDALVRADAKLEPVIKQYGGIRILNQDFVETLISFIISQNKNIPHIKQIIRLLSEAHGEKIGQIDLNICDSRHCGSEIKKILEQEGLDSGINGNGTAQLSSCETKRAENDAAARNSCGITREYYSFPDIEHLSRISEEEFRRLKTGFRAPYLKDAVDKLVSGEISEGTLRFNSGNDLIHGSSEINKVLDNKSFENNKERYEAAKKKLISIKGVGDKVANCVLLFGVGYRNAFPVDVWIYRIMNDLYRDEMISEMGLAQDIKDIPKNIMKDFAYRKFGEYGGYAQQYLFIYARNQ